MTPWAVLAASGSVSPLAAASRSPNLAELSYSIVGDAPLEVRIAKLMRAVTLGLHDERAVARIRRVVSRCPANDDACRLGAGLYDLRQAIRYRHDDDNLDRYPPYSVSVDLGYGDCSAMTVAWATHAQVCGCQPGACTIMQVNPTTGALEWNHVYGVALAHVGDRMVRVAADVSERAVPLNWEPQAWRVRGKRDWMYDAATWDRWFRDGANDDRLPDVTYRDIP